jgi:hypothetical protein
MQHLPPYHFYKDATLDWSKHWKRCSDADIEGLFAAPVAAPLSPNTLYAMKQANHGKLETQLKK